MTIAYKFFFLLHKMGWILFEHIDLGMFTPGTFSLKKKKGGIKYNFFIYINKKTYNQKKRNYNKIKLTQSNE